jgi:predicted HTH transcriptional regulator
VFGVRDADLEFVGVSTQTFESIDPTDVLGMLRDNAAPKVRCAVYKRGMDGKRVVVFEVAEFEASGSP